MSTSINLNDVAKTIQPSKLTSFVNDARLMADEIEQMAASTPMEDQAYGAAKILQKYGCV